MTRWAEVFVDAKAIVLAFLSDSEADVERGVKGRRGIFISLALVAFVAVLFGLNTRIRNAFAGAG